jgi:mono/diheme cytochrome c family protein
VFGWALRQPRAVRGPALVVIAFLLGAWGAPPAIAQARRGWPIYERFCLACHGARGDGQGPAAPYAWPPPRDFTRGELKWRSVPAGQSATLDDLRATIRLGAPGTSMPAFPALTPAQLDDVIDVVRGFAPAALDAHATAAAAPKPRPTPIVLGAPPPPDPSRGAALWTAKGCATCHGAGDGRVAARIAAYDLAVMHRPREPGVAALRAAAAWSIATGLTGTTMPSFAGALRDDELWALADHVVTLAGRDARQAMSRGENPTVGHAMDAAMIATDRAAPIAVATWPGRGAPDEAAVFGAPIPAQGPPPASLAPAQASLHARQCGRCHAKQVREWQPSLHGGAASPGLLAQFDSMPARQRARCLRCHAPLAEQASDPALRSEGVSCAGCHVRSWVRHGPPVVAPSLLPLPGYPLVTLGLYERADFCMPCHQLPPRDAVAGRPLLNTYKEWLDGPYASRGVQCQHCHMPNREHTVLGIHDPATFRQGIELTATARRHGAAVTATVKVKNIGAGHYLPTTPTPAAWVSITLVDARGQPIVGASARHRIGRDIWFDGEWHERADTRIPPGETTTVARAWTAGRTAQATAARITIEVHPDDYYERFYADQLAGKLSPASRALYQQALTRALGNRYVAERRDVAIQP